MTTWRAIEAGADLRDRHGRKLKPLGPASLRKLPSMLEAILDDAIALLANNFDVKWVMAQVGHADSRMTMDVYAQLEQRVKREHGESFDRLVRQAGESQANEIHGEQLLAQAA
jgi:integrase